MAHCWIAENGTPASTLPHLHKFWGKSGLHLFFLAQLCHDMLTYAFQLPSIPFLERAISLTQKTTKFFTKMCRWMWTVKSCPAHTPPDVQDSFYFLLADNPKFKPDIIIYFSTLNIACISISWKLFHFQ